MRGTRPDEVVLRNRLKGGASALRLSMAACVAQTGKLCDLALSRPGPVLRATEKPVIEIANPI